ANKRGDDALPHRQSWRLAAADPAGWRCLDAALRRAQPLRSGLSAARRDGHRRRRAAIRDAAGVLRGAVAVDL
ncbi:MAG: Zinc-regulated outer membrane receptor, partial [uncultured Craurococcus sp.]